MQGEKCKWFMMGSIKAVQGKVAQIPDLRQEKQKVCIDVAQTHELE